MIDAERVWITHVPVADAHDLYLVVGIDLQGELGEQVVSELLSYGHEGAEGVFHLLPDDLWARCERVGSRISVRLLAWPETVARTLAERGQDPAGLPPGELIDGRVTLVHREIDTDTDFLEGVTGEKPPVVVIDHPGPATLEQLLASVKAGETGVAVVGAD